MCFRKLRLRDSSEEIIFNVRPLIKIKRAIKKSKRDVNEWTVFVVNESRDVVGVSRPMLKCKVEDRKIDNKVFIATGGELVGGIDMRSKSNFFRIKCLFLLIILVLTENRFTQPNTVWSQRAHLKWKILYFSDIQFFPFLFR